MIDHDQQLAFEQVERRSPKGTATDMRLRVEILRANRGRVLTVEEIERQLAARGKR